MSALRVISMVFACFLVPTLFLAAPGVYEETYRPQVHFSPREHWTNDPNGLVYFQGEYHMFFQFNPFGDVWGHMSWGHAVSTDLLHWKELPVAIPEADGEMVFTGSVVVDRDNTSGFCAKGKECLVAVYTGYRRSEKLTRQVQDIAYSLDNGRTWTRYEKNPVLDLGMEDFRDPSVFWDERAGQWVMAVSLPKEHKIRFYQSADLKQWNLLSEFGPAGNVEGDWECPDLLRVPAEDDEKIPTSGKTSQKSGTHLWALKVGLNPGAPQGGSGEQYFLGEFDGKHFVQSKVTGSHGLTNYGKDDYCAISFNGPTAAEKPVLIGWMNNWEYAAKLPTSPWRGQMSIPRRLSFVKDDAGMALKQEPVIAALRGEHRAITTGAEMGTVQAPFELDLDFGNVEEKQFGIRLYSDDQHWTEIGFDRGAGQFYIDRRKSSVTVASEFPARTVAPLVAERPLNLKLIVDRSSVEAFAQGETIAMTDLIFPVSNHSKVVSFSATGKPISVKGDVWKLRSIWK